MATSKPSTPFLWASGASSTREDPGTTKIATGWSVNEAPGSKVINWLYYYFASFIAHINDYGIASYDASTDYALGALSSYSGTVYRRTSAGSGGGNPNTSTSWEVYVDAVSLTSNVTLNVPTDYATLQEAFNAVRNYKPNGFQVTINVESGHSITSGLACSSGNYGFIRITSTDNEPTISGSFPAAESIISAVACVAPILDALFNMGGGGGNGISLDRSQIYVNGSRGVKNAGAAGVDLSNVSSLAATTCNFSGAATYGCRAKDVSVADINGGDFSGADIGIESNDASSINASAADCTGAITAGMRASGGRITAPNSDTSGGLGVGYSVANGGILSAAGGSGTSDATPNTITAQGLYLA